MGMPAIQQPPPPPAAAASGGVVSLYEILDAFGAPMSEEHAWALAFQTCKMLQRLWNDYQQQRQQQQQQLLLKRQQQQLQLQRQQQQQQQQQQQHNNNKNNRHQHQHCQLHHASQQQAQQQQRHLLLPQPSLRQRHQQAAPAINGTSSNATPLSAAASSAIASAPPTMQQRLRARPASLHLSSAAPLLLSAAGSTAQRRRVETAAAHSKRSLQERQPTAGQSTTPLDRSGQLPSPSVVATAAAPAATSRSRSAQFQSQTQRQSQFSSSSSSSSKTSPTTSSSSSLTLPVTSDVSRRSSPLTTPAATSKGGQAIKQVVTTATTTMEATAFATAARTAESRQAIVIPSAAVANHCATSERDNNGDVGVTTTVVDGGDVGVATTVLGGGGNVSGSAPGIKRAAGDGRRPAPPPPPPPVRVFLVENLKHVRICSDGTVHPSTASDDATVAQSESKTRPRKAAASEQQLVQSVGVVLFRALDFRLGPDEQRSLSPAMDLLLDKMTSAADDEDDDTAHTATAASAAAAVANGARRRPHDRCGRRLCHSRRRRRRGGNGDDGGGGGDHQNGGEDEEEEDEEEDGDNDSEGGGRNSAADSEGAYDEGIHDVELDDETRSGSPEVDSGRTGGDHGEAVSDGLTLDKVIQMCSAHMSLGNQADSHYRAVCRAFVAEWLELTTFLREVSKGTKELRSKSSYEVCATGSDDDGGCSNLDELGFQDWARLWVQVIRELRQGVVLKKVRFDHPPQTEPSIEYELTPYEMLLDDIRSRRYKLNKVMVNGELPPRVKKDAFALILEFIRSRPPLVPVGQRRLKQLPAREPPLHERLMDAIRQQHRLRHVTTRYSSILDYGWNFGSDTCGGLSLSSTTTNDSDESPPSYPHSRSSGRSAASSTTTSVCGGDGGQQFGTQRRLIHVDLMFSDDELEDSESSGSVSLTTKHPSIEFLSTTSSSCSPCDGSSSPTLCSPIAATAEHQSLPANLKRRASRLSWQKPTCAQQQDLSLPVGTTTGRRPRRLWRRHSIDVCDAEHQERLARRDPFRRSIRVLRQDVFRTVAAGGGNAAGDASCYAVGGTGGPAVGVYAKETTANKIALVNKQLECLSLTLEEVAHIRSVMTKAELETLLVTPQLYEDVARSKVCFTCRKNRFNVLFSRPIKCHLCERAVCDKCSTKMHIPTHRFDRIPVYMLSPSTSFEECSQELPARDKKHRRKKDEIESAVQVFTSGSAPSSPNLNARISGGRGSFSLEASGESSPTIDRTEQVISAEIIATTIGDSVDGRRRCSAPASPASDTSTSSSRASMKSGTTSSAGRSSADLPANADTYPDRASAKKKSWQDSISKSLLKRPSILRVRAKLRGSPKPTNAGLLTNGSTTLDELHGTVNGDTVDSSAATSAAAIRAERALCEQLKAPVLPVCRDCKYLVRSIILSNRNPIVKSHSGPDATAATIIVGASQPAAAALGNACGPIAVTGQTTGPCGAALSSESSVGYVNGTVKHNIRSDWR